MREVRRERASSTRHVGYCARFSRERVLDATSLDARLLPRGYSARGRDELLRRSEQAKAWGDEKLPQMKEKMKEIAENAEADRAS